MINATLKDLSPDLAPIRNRELDRQRVAERLSTTLAFDGVNTKRRDTAKYSLGDFVLIHRDSEMHKTKSDYEFMGPYEITRCFENGRYELKKVGSNVVTKAAKEQLRLWPKQWQLDCDMEHLLAMLEADESDANVSTGEVV